MAVLILATLNTSSVCSVLLRICIIVSSAHRVDLTLLSSHSNPPEKGLIKECRGREEEPCAAYVWSDSLDRQGNQRILLHVYCIWKIHVYVCAPPAVTQPAKAPGPETC